MEILFTVFLLLSSVAMLFLDPDGLLSALVGGGSQGVQFALRMFGVYGVWLSVMELWKKLKFDAFLSKGLRGVLKKIFPGESEACYNDLSVNLSANLLGMGGAGTPAGIEATAEMTSKKNRVMLIVLNASSLQILPTTVIALRASYGAVTDIILPSLITTVVTTATAYLLVKIFVK